ncbi:hypothetical protein KAX22_02195, partial [bacterium]|nr:hypothetical protein [bacterium]
NDRKEGVEDSRGRGFEGPQCTTPVSSRQEAKSEMQNEKCKVKNAKWKKQLNFAFTNPGSRIPFFSTLIQDPASRIQHRFFFQRISNLEPRQTSFL